MRRLVAGQKVLEVLAESLQTNKTTINYRQVLVGQGQMETRLACERVALWCPSNGYQAVYDAVALTALSNPEKMVVYVSDSLESSPEGVDFLDWLDDVVDGACARARIELEVVCKSRSERLHHLEKLNPTHTIVYGGDEVCRVVLGHVDPLSKRTVYRNKTSLGLCNLYLGPEEFRPFLVDSMSGGGSGCLNTTAVYVTPLTAKNRKEVAEVFEEELQKRNLQADVASFHVQLAAKGLGPEILDTYAGGRLVFRSSTSGETDIPPVGVGGGTLVIVESISPNSAMESEWRHASGVLSSCSTDFRNTTLYKMGFSRLCDPGEAQSPNDLWFHDGMKLIPETYEYAR